MGNGSLREVGADRNGRGSEGEVMDSIEEEPRCQNSGMKAVE